MKDARTRLYDAYVSTHLGTYRAASRETFEQDRRVFRATFGHLLPADRDAAILDVGCGAGSFLNFLRAEGYTQITGIDISEEQVQAARALGIREIEVAEAERYLLAHPQTFDCVVALDVLEHLKKGEVLSVLDATYQALRPGGRVLLRVPNGDSINASWVRYGDFTHELMFTPLSIGQVLRVAGFVEIQVLPLEPVVHGVASAIRWMLWKFIKQLIRVYWLAEQGTLGSGVFTSNLAAAARKPDR